ncbi:MAG: RNA polymerase sigma factor, partial [Myxococcota bacterium]
MVHGLTYRLLGRPSDAEEVAQDTLAAAFRALPRLRDPDRFAPWLRGICIKKCRSRIRSLTVRRRFGVVDHAPLDLTRYASADASPDVIAELRLLARCVDRLTTEERIVLMLVRVEGLTLPETADQIGLSLATVKRRLSRAAARLEK